MRVPSSVPALDITDGQVQKGGTEELQDLLDFSLFPHPTAHPALEMIFRGNSSLQPHETAVFVADFISFYIR